MRSFSFSSDLGSCCLLLLFACVALVPDHLTLRVAACFLPSGSDAQLRPLPGQRSVHGCCLSSPALGNELFSLFPQELVLIIDCAASKRPGFSTLILFVAQHRGPSVLLLFVCAAICPPFIRCPAVIWRTVGTSKSERGRSKCPPNASGYWGPRF